MKKSIEYFSHSQLLGLIAIKAYFKMIILELVTRGQFNQPFKGSFYTRRSQKRKKTLMT